MRVVETAVAAAPKRGRSGELTSVREGGGCRGGLG
jgi:hypothetical protein